METTMKKKAQRFLAELNANVDDWYNGWTRYDTFTRRQRTTWDAIHGAGEAVEELVLSALLERLPSTTGSSR